MVKILIFSRESNWFGGVVNFIDLMKKSYSSETASEQFLVGRRKGRFGLILRPFTPFVDAVKLFFRVVTHKYDCFHLNPSLNGPSLIRDGLFILVLKLLNCKNILLCFHGWELTTEKTIETSWWRKWLFVKIFCNVDCILVLARPFKTWLVRQGCDDRKIKLFTTMFDGKFLTNEKRGKLPENANINLLFLSRFVSEKGIYELLEAFKSVASEHDNVRLIFAGTGPEETKMQEWVDKEGLSDKIEFKGYVRDDDKADVLKQSHIFTFPTYYGEGCPVSLLEAMAAGMAIITTPVGGIPDIIEHDKNGILLDAKVTADNIKTAIEALLNSPDCIHNMGEINRIEAWEKYDAPVVTQFFEDIYKGGCR
ncbi:MAG: glycosyltransferase family 4 protein [Pseudomonadota bacterium]